MTPIPLQDRYLSDTAIEYGWKYTDNFKFHDEIHKGFIYPILSWSGDPLYNSKGHQIQRFKNLDSNAKPKYAWMGSPDHGADNLAYFTKDFDIESDYLFLSSGDVDLVTAGAYGLNSLCFLTGENSFRVERARLICQLMPNLRYVITLPNADEKGYLYALSIHDAFQEIDPEVVVQIRKPPFEFGSKKDFTDLWIINKGDADLVEVQFNNLEILSPEKIQGLVGRKKKLSQMDSDSQYQEWQLAIVRKLSEIDTPEQRGEVLYFHCPFHEDSTPSLEIKKGTYTPVLIGFCHCLDVERDDFHKILWDDLADYTKIPRFKQWLNIHLENKVQTEFEINYHNNVDTISLHNFVDGGEFARSMPFPFKEFHRFGGLFQELIAGMVLLIIGNTGTFKTTFLTMLIDNLLQQGAFGIMYGTEWNNYHYGIKRLQKLGLFSFTEFYEYIRYQKYKKANLPIPIELNHIQEGEYYYRKLFELAKAIDDEYGHRFRVLKQVDSWKKLKENIRGEYHHVIDYWNEKPFFLSMDYMQLFKNFGDGGIFDLDGFLTEIEELSQELDMVGIVISQAGKNEHRQTFLGNSLNKMSGQMLSGYQAKGILTLNPQYDNSDNLQLMSLEIGIDKNNMGSEGLIKDVLIGRGGTLVFPQEDYAYSVYRNLNQKPIKERILSKLEIFDNYNISVLDI